MAEIPVEKKSSSSWLWILLAIIVLALLLWWIFADNDEEEVAVAEPVAVEQQADVGAAAGPMTIAAVLANPADYYDMEGFTIDATVGDEITDRGFWIESGGSQMFALIVDQPREEPIDINPGAELRITGGTIRNPADIGQDLPGDELDQDTQRILQEQEAVLVVNESNIDITEGA
jgi:hypothetical protein